MAKRGNGEGSIYRLRNRKTGKLDGLWVGVYHVDTPSGLKRRQVSGRTRAEVAAKLAKAIAERDAGFVFDAGNMTVGEYLDHWMDVVKRDTVKLTTWQSYERNLRLHVKPLLGRVRLDKLCPAQVQALYRDRLDSGLSTRMVRLVHVTLRQALEHAVTGGLVPRNVTDAVKPPRVVQSEISALTIEESRALLSYARETGDRYEPLYALALTAGLRQGELLGLKWEDVNLDTGKLRVRRILSTARTEGFVFTTPKTKKSRRSVKLSAVAVRALKRQRKMQLEESLAADGTYNEHGVVFTQPNGNPVFRQSLMTRHFKPLLRDAGLPDVRFHDLRHTCATILLAAGKHPKFVQELLGHATISITLDTYSHVLEGMDGGLGDAMDEALG